MKSRILVLNATCLDVVERYRDQIESRGVELVAEQRFRSISIEQTAALVREADAVVLPAAAGRALPSAEQMEISPRLLCCAIAASGFDDFPVEAATRNGIVVTNAPVREGAEVVADMAFALMLSVARQIPYHHNLLLRGDVTRGAGVSIFGKTLGIVGLGNIGRSVALRARGFDMRVLATDPDPDRAFAADHEIELVPQDELLHQADFVTLHVRLNEQTRHMISRRELTLMKPTAHLINTARRDLVDEEALVEAIAQKRLAGAALDDPPGHAAKQLFDLPNVIFTPHLGNRSVEGMRAVFLSAIDSAIAVLGSERPRFVINPAVYDIGVRKVPGRS